MVGVLPVYMAEESSHFTRMNATTPVQGCNPNGIGLKSIVSLVCVIIGDSDDRRLL